MLLKNKIQPNRLTAVVVPVIVLFIIQSCTKVIHLSLNSAAPQYVIEGVITNHAGDCQVLISKTKDFDEDNNFTGVSGAEIIITDDNGNSTRLSETTSGTYIAPALTAVTNGIYTLSIRLDTLTFTAQSVMPAEVNFDSLYISNELLLGSALSLSNIQFNDPAGKGNYYNFKQWVNGKITRSLYPLSDETNDGNQQTAKLYMLDAEDEEKIKSGDSVKVEMQCINAAIYKYWYSADQGATGDGSGSVPANPVSNIQGNALGYFSAHTTQVKTVVVP